MPFYRCIRFFINCCFTHCHLVREEQLQYLLVLWSHLWWTKARWIKITTSLIAKPSCILTCRQTFNKLNKEIKTLYCWIHIILCISKYHTITHSNNRFNQKANVVNGMQCYIMWFELTTMMSHLGNSKVQQNLPVLFCSRCQRLLLCLQRW